MCSAAQEIPAAGKSAVIVVVLGRGGEVQKQIRDFLGWGEPKRLRSFWGEG